MGQHLTAQHLGTERGQSLRPRHQAPGLHRLHLAARVRVGHHAAIQFIGARKLTRLGHCGADAEAALGWLGQKHIARGQAARRIHLRGGRGFAVVVSWPGRCGLGAQQRGGGGGQCQQGRYQCCRHCCCHPWGHAPPPCGPQFDPCHHDKNGCQSGSQRTIGPEVLVRAIHSRWLDLRGDHQIAAEQVIHRLAAEGGAHGGGDGELTRCQCRREGDIESAVLGRCGLEFERHAAGRLQLQINRGAWHRRVAGKFVEIQHDGFVLDDAGQLEQIRVGRKARAGAGGLRRSSGPVAMIVAWPGGSGGG